MGFQKKITCDIVSRYSNIQSYIRYPLFTYLEQWWGTADVQIFVSQREREFWKELFHIDNETKCAFKTSIVWLFILHHIISHHYKNLNDHLAGWLWVNWLFRWIFLQFHWIIAFLIELYLTHTKYKPGDIRFQNKWFR